jgi:hypothetical protein
MAVRVTVHINLEEDSGYFFTPASSNSGTDFSRGRGRIAISRGLDPSHMTCPNQMNPAKLLQTAANPRNPSNSTKPLKILTQLLLARPALNSYLDPIFNCKAPSVTSFLHRYIGGKEGTPLRGEVGIPYVTSHQRLDSVKFDEKIDQKNQQYKQKQYLIRDPIVRYRSVNGPSTVRSRSVNGPFTGLVGFLKYFAWPTDYLAGKVSVIYETSPKTPGNKASDGIFPSRSRVQRRHDGFRSRRLS